MAERGTALNDTKALARKLGLSRWAISRALNHQPGVGEGTRARVLAEVARGTFEPNAHARSLRGAGPGVVGLALPGLRDPVWTPLATGLCEGLLVRGLQPDWMLGTGVTGGESRVWSRYAARHVAAVLVLGAGTLPFTTTDGGLPAWEELRRRKVPIIFIEPAWAEEPDGWCVLRSDHRCAAALVTGHLQSHGHRGVELRGFRGREQSRALALQAACEARGMTCTSTPPEEAGGPIGFPGAEGARSPRPRPTRSRHAWTAAEPPSAIVAADDLHALRVLCELRATGRAVPGDVSLVGYGDEPAGALAAPSLTSVDPQREQLVARALELLDALRRDAGRVEAGSIWIPPLLRCRGSVGSVPTGASYSLSA